MLVWTRWHTVLKHAAGFCVTVRGDTARWSSPKACHSDKCAFLNPVNGAGRLRSGWRFVQPDRSFMSGPEVVRVVRFSKKLAPRGCIKVITKRLRKINSYFSAPDRARRPERGWSVAAGAAVPGRAPPRHASPAGVSSSAPADGAVCRAPVLARALCSAALI